VIVDVTPSLGEAQCRLVIGDAGALVIVRALAAELITCVPHEGAISALLHAVWGDGTRDAGACSMRVASSDGFHSMTESTSNPEIALNWLVETLDRIDDGKSGHAASSS